jgi:type VI secretion system protein VasD
MPWVKAAPVPVQVSVIAAARLNPDEHGESLPTAVRIYQLTGAARAAKAELSDLLRDPKEVLGEELLRVDEILVGPGGTAARELPCEAKARALLVVGLFRRPAGTTWRELIELPGEGIGLKLEFHLEDYRLVRR